MRCVWGVMRRSSRFLGSMCWCRMVLLWRLLGWCTDIINDFFFNSVQLLSGTPVFGFGDLTLLFCSQDLDRFGHLLNLFDKDVLAHSLTYNWWIEVYHYLIQLSMELISEACLTSNNKFRGYCCFDVLIYTVHFMWYIKYSCVCFYLIIVYSYYYKYVQFYYY